MIRVIIVLGVAALLGIVTFAINIVIIIIVLSVIIIAIVIIVIIILAVSRAIL